MPVMCKICDKYFSNQSNHNKHLKNMHKLNPPALRYDKSIWNYRCLENNCNNSFQQNKGLIDHLTDTHSLKFEIMEILVKDMNEFYVWKSQVEKENNYSYIFKSKCSSTNGEISYYNCNRSRSGKSVRELNKEYKRLLKSQGSCKMESCCTSQIKLINNHGSSMCIQWQKTHYGHTTDLQHIRLFKEDRQIVSTKLINGVTPAKILESTRDDIATHLKRIDLLTSKDIYNIKESFNIAVTDGKRHQDDAISIDLWVTECLAKESDDNPVLHYKRQGDLSDMLEEKDFCLIIMNRSQKAMLEQFGSNIITIDSTHGLNGYDFLLTTLMVIDEFNQGFPVAFMFSNRQDTLICNIFFQKIKSVVGTIYAKTFMSDLAESFYNAWCSIMGETLHQLYCAWHIDRAWQSNLSKISNLEKRHNVYKVLKVLQQETDASLFHNALNNALENLLCDKDTEIFGKYFSTNYSCNYRKWAYCFRAECGINTNMHLESMHKVIKYFYLDRKTVKRLDKGVNVVLRYVRDKSVERIIKLTKGKNTPVLKNIFERHNKALGANYNIESNDNHWKLVKETGEFYDIHKLSNNSCCEIYCSSCFICIHMYSCTCFDYEKNKIICKHIHYIIQSISLKIDKNVGVIKSTSHECEDFVNTLNQNKTTESIDSKLDKKITLTFSKLQQMDLQNLDSDVVQQILYHLNIISNLSVLPKCSKGGKLLLLNKNKIIRPQIRFSSTKRKRKTERPIYERPTKEETVSITNVLTESSDLFISTSAHNDHFYAQSN